jgi:hypothetical protein
VGVWVDVDAAVRPRFEDCVVGWNEALHNSLLSHIGFPKLLLGGGGSSDCDAWARKDDDAVE